MLGNFLYQVVYQILVLILPLVTIPYTSRVLGVEGIGLYSYSYAVVSYFVSFANMGISIYGNREIASVQGDKEKRSQQFWDLFEVQLIFAFISLFIYLSIIVCGTWENKLVFIVQGIYIIGQAFDINWFYFGLEKFKVTVTRNLLVKIITTLLVFLLVKSPVDLIKYILILAVGSSIGNSVVWIFIKQYIVLKRPQLNNIKKCIKPIFILMLPSFAVKMYTQMDKIFIRIFGELKQVGYYENAEKILSIAFIFITALSTVMLPRMAKLYAEKEKEKFTNLFHRIISIVSWLTIALMFGMIGIADTLVEVYLGKEFLPSISILIILAIAIPFKGSAEIVRRGYIMPSKNDRIYVISIFVGAGVNVLINLALIPFLGATGAAIGTVVAEVTVFLIQVWKIRNDINIYFFLKENNIYMLVGIVMLFVVKGLHLLMPDLSLVIIVLLQIIIGAIVYISGTGVILWVKYRNNKGVLRDIFMRGKY